MQVRLAGYNYVKCALPRSRHLSTASQLATSGERVDDNPEGEHKEARRWLAQFSVKSIPKGACDVSFSRASGPGGQNVNKCAREL